MSERLSSSTRQVLPDGIASMAPGPELAAALASIKFDQLMNSDMYIAVAAQLRQVSGEQARLLAWMRQVARDGYHDDDCDRGASCSCSPERSPEDGLDEFSVDQLASEMSWSQPAARAYVDLGEDLIGRLPAVFEALAAGRIDLPKARAYSEALSHLDGEKTGWVVRRTLTQAFDCTVGQLRQRLRYWALRADPALATRRYQERVVGRRVFARLDDDGTAALVAQALPPDRTAAIMDRLHRLARTAKAAGDVRTLSQLQADAMMDLLTGVAFAAAPSCDPITADADAADRGEDRGEPDSGDQSPSRAADGLADAPEAVAATQPGVVTVHLSLDTLLGRNEDPATIPGLGPILAEIARQVAADAANQFRYTLHDATGRVLSHGILRRRHFTAAHTAFIRARDVTCRAKGCQRPATHCDNDHIRPYASGGPTHPSNATTLCAHHHRLKHRRGFAIRRSADGTTHWRAPNGRRYSVPPERDLHLPADG